MNHIRGKAILGLLLVSATISAADDRYVLQYDAPAKDNLLVKQRERPKGLGYIQTALPMGNGRLGAMFSGGIDTEHLLINDITLWMNAKRGLDEVAQSGTRKGALRHLVTVRQAYREGKYGTKPGSMESLSTEYLSSTEPLGNYAPFTDLLISTGHDPTSVSDYRRSLDARTGLGSVSYRIGEGRFAREYFCSHPNDVIVVRYTAEKTKLNLTIHATTKHRVTLLKAESNRIVLTAEAGMVQDDVALMQVVQVDSGDGKLTPQTDGSLTVSGATDVRIVLTGYSDYLPVYPSFKGRDYKADCEKTIVAAGELGYDALKEAHVADVSALMNRCRLELEIEWGVHFDKKKYR